MLILISPAKSLKTADQKRSNTTVSRNRKDSFELIKVLRQLNASDLMDLMHISESLAIENVKRYKKFRKEHNPLNSKTAIDQFDGAVYKG